MFYVASDATRFFSWGIFFIYFTNVFNNHWCVNLQSNLPRHFLLLYFKKSESFERRKDAVVRAVYVLLA